SRLNMTDDADAIALKIRRARTDPGPLPDTIAVLEARHEADILVGIYAALTDSSRVAAVARFVGEEWSAVKGGLSEVAVGVGGGFLLTPMLIFIGVPPAVAVASSANQLVGASVSGVLAHWRRGNVDFKMGFVLLIGGLAGSVLGVWLFTLLKRLGQIELTISVCYVVLLGTLGFLMGFESVRALLRQRRPGGARRKLHQHNWMHGLPLKTRFRRSKLYISALLPIGLGVAVGTLSAILGVGGGFVLVPAMIYMLGMPTQVVPGTSLLQIIFVAANVTFLQAYTNRTVDAGLTLVLLLGGVLGAQFGPRCGMG